MRSAFNREDFLSFIDDNKRCLPTGLLTKRKEHILIYYLAGYKRSEIARGLGVSTDLVSKELNSVGIDRSPAEMINKFYFNILITRKIPVFRSDMPILPTGSAGL